VLWAPPLTSAVGVILPPAPPALVAATGTGPARVPVRRSEPRSLAAPVAPALPEPFTPRTRASADPWAGLLRAADQARAAQAALRIERLRRQAADRGADVERRARERAAREREERP
jgi:hypothetical protein